MMWTSRIGIGTLTSLDKVGPSCEWSLRLAVAWRAPLWHFQTPVRYTRLGNACRERGKWPFACATPGVAVSHTCFKTASRYYFGNVQGLNLYNTLDEIEWVFKMLR